MEECVYQFYCDFFLICLWGYNGLFFGFIIEVKRNENVYVKWMNNFLLEYFFLIDYMIYYSDSQYEELEVKIVVYLYGGVMLDDSDGYLEVWFFKDFE